MHLENQIIQLTASVVQAIFFILPSINSINFKIGNSVFIEIFCSVHHIVMLYGDRRKSEKT